MSFQGHFHQQLISFKARMGAQLVLRFWVEVILQAFEGGWRLAFRPGGWRWRRTLGNSGSWCWPPPAGSCPAPPPGLGSQRLGWKTGEDHGTGERLWVFAVDESEPIEIFDLYSGTLLWDVVSYSGYSKRFKWCVRRAWATKTKHVNVEMFFNVIRCGNSPLCVDPFFIRCVLSLFYHLCTRECFTGIYCIYPHLAGETLHWLIAYISIT